MKKTLSKVLAVIIAVMLVVSTMPVAFAVDGDIASGTAGEGVNWVIDAEGTLTISGEGAIVVDWYAPPWQDYNDSIFNIVVEEGITKIPSTAFCYANNAMTLSIPASVTEMPINETPIFWGSYCSLNAVNVHQDNPTFTSVDGIVFSKDKTLLYLYPMSKSDDSYTIPDTVTDINAYAFGFNETLKSVVISDTVINMGHSAFYSANVESVTIGSGIKNIQRNCFGYCDGIESIIIPDSVETIEYDAFWGCSYLKNIIIGSGVNTICSGIFEHCDVITAVHYNGTADGWGEIIIEEENEKLNGLSVHYVSDIGYKDAVGATCTTDGHTAGDYCNVCGDYMSGEVTDPALGHDYVAGVCQRDDCGYVCEHINQEFDNKCDDCGLEVELELSEISVGETKTAYIEEAHKQVYVKFVPKESGEYVLFSDNGGDDENIDPYVSLYDSKFNEIDYSDDDDYSYNFELIFDADKGKTYYFALSDRDNVEYAYTLDKHIGIGHQPTSAEPYVELTWDIDATYQWYTADVSETEITNQNAEVVTYDWGESSYDAENGWSGVPYNEGGTEYDFFTIGLDANETVTVELIGDYSDGVGLWDYTAGDGLWISSTGEKFYELVAEEAGDYTFYTYTDSGNLTVKAYLGGLQYTKIEGEKTNTLSSATVGEKYVCIATLEDSVLVSNVFECTYAITHQPTEKEPYVKVNDDTDIKYQWYSVTEELDEITDEDVSFEDFSPEMVLPTYDAQDGWTGIPMTEDTLFFFELSLEAGETVKIGANKYVSAVAMFVPVEGGFGDEAYFNGGGEAILTAPVDGEYYIIALATEDARLKVYKHKCDYTKLNGETSVELKKIETGTSYACEVTFADGSTEMSDIINKRYSDVPFSQWYSDAVEYVSSFGIMTGYGGTTNFGTADKITRHDFVVILARLAGVDLSVYDDATINFTDVKEDQYYTNAILWAADAGITSGYTSGPNAGKFGVGDVITREQLVTFLYRYAKYTNDGVVPEVSDKAADNAAAYADFGTVTGYAQDAVIWALENGVIKGQGGTHIDPAGNALRCEVAQMIYNIYLNDIF